MNLGEESECGKKTKTVSLIKPLVGHTIERYKTIHQERGIAAPKVNNQEREERMSKNKKLKKKGFDWKDTERFDKTASEVGGALGNLESQITQLKMEIKADEQGVFDFDSRLGFLYKEMEMLQSRVEQNEIWAKKFDDKIGPFEKKYVGLTDGISGIYNNAKEKHAIGIEVLKKEFNYHPLWKLSDDDFTATPFRPN